MQMDILAWEYTPYGPQQVQQVIQPGGTQTLFAFGDHQTGVTYPAGFTNPNGIVMNVLATPTDRTLFYQTRLLGTGFANEQCVVYQGTGGGQNPTASGNCIVYSYTCQDSTGNSVTCPTELNCTSDPNQCIDINTTFYTTDNVTPTNADYLENDALGSNNWMSIFTSYQNAPIDGTTSGKGGGFGNGGDSRFKKNSSLPTRRVSNIGTTPGADIVATFRPKQP